MSYIKRKMALKAIKEHPANIAPFTKKAMDAIENIPPADVVEVRHGEWKPDLIADAPYKDESYGYIFKCSVCGNQEIGALYNIECKSKYCPHCGAKMDGERREE